MPRHRLPRVIRDAIHRAGRPLRRAPVRLGVSILVVVITMAVTWSLLARAEAGARRFGSERVAVIARRDLEPGDVIDATSAVIRMLPGDAIAPRAIRTINGQRVIDPVRRGQVIVPADLTSHRSPLAAALEPGRRAIGLSADRIGLALERGDIIDVWALGGDGTMVTVASRADVLRTGGRTVTIAVDSNDAGAVAAAVSAETAVVTLRPG